MIIEATRAFVLWVREAEANSHLSLGNSLPEITDFPCIVIEGPTVQENRLWDTNHHFRLTKNMDDYSYEKRRGAKYFDLGFQLVISAKDEMDILKIEQKITQFIASRGELVFGNADESYACLISRPKGLERPEDKRLSGSHEGIATIRVEMVPVASIEPPVRGRLVTDILIDLQPKDNKEEL